MVCIAAFIILALLSLPVLALSIIGKYKPKVAKFTKPYFAMFKKAWYCVGRRVTFRKCDSNFKDDIKNSVLSRLIIKHKKWVKPVSVAIEIAAVLIVALAAWSLVEVTKSSLSIYVYGTCNVTQPEACILGEGNVCSTVNAGEKKNPFVRYFEEWGDIFKDLPGRIKKWDATEYIPENANYQNYEENKPFAVDFLDPGCVNCQALYENQLKNNFFDHYNVALVPYPILNSAHEDGYEFPNSYLLSTYIEAVRDFARPEIPAPEWQIVNKLFTEKVEISGQKIPMQRAFNGLSGLTGTPYEPEKAENLLKTWLVEFGFTEEEVVNISKKAHSEEIAQRILRNIEVFDQQIASKAIPTTIYDDRRHTGI